MVEGYESEEGRAHRLEREKAEAERVQAAELAKEARHAKQLIPGVIRVLRSRGAPDCMVELWGKTWLSTAGFPRVRSRQPAWYLGAIEIGRYRGGHGNEFVRMAHFALGENRKLYWNLRGIGQRREFRIDLVNGKDEEPLPPGFLELLQETR